MLITPYMVIVERDSGSRTHYSLFFGYTSGFADQEGHQPLAPHSGIAFVFQSVIHSLPVVALRLLFFIRTTKQQIIKYT